MLRRLLFGTGEITNRLVCDQVHVALEWKIQDLWVGLYWRRHGHEIDVWICVVPCLPIHIWATWHDPMQ
jgi:hypothetical protein